MFGRFVQAVRPDGGQQCVATTQIERLVSERTMSKLRVAAFSISIDGLSRQTGSTFDSAEEL
jgi:hypothetical protein